MRLDQISVESIIVHEIPHHYSRPGTPAAQPILSDVESPLNQQIKNFFQEKIVKSLDRRALDVEIDSTSESRAPDCIAAILADVDGEQFVSTSQELANILYQSQTGSSPPGLLAVLKLDLGGRPGIAITKLEKDEGTRVNMVTLDTGRTLSVEFIRELMLTGKTRVFKVGVFGVDPETEEIEGRVSDEQQTVAGVHIAYFFLQRFLGCRLTQLPEVMTERYLAAAEQFMNSALPSSEEKASFHLALVADLISQEATLRPEAFAKKQLKTERRAAFVAAIEAAEVPTTAFPKNTSRIEPTLKRMQWTFEGGTTVLSPANQVGDLVTVESLRDGRTKLEVTDHLRDVKGHR
jgi:37-kD nucleoid-associated bacterial protein